jgi:predicted DNA-binding WGR domain protein
MNNGDYCACQSQHIEFYPYRKDKNMPYFEFIGEDASRKSEKAEKYWEITQVGKNVTVRFGKIGADGQLKVKEFDNKEDAEAEVEKLIKEKTKKGYVEKPNPHK